MVPASTAFGKRDRMASALASPSLSTGYSHSLSFRTDDSDIVPSIQSPSELQERHLDDDSEACSAQQDQRRVSLLDRGLEREVVVIQQSPAPGTNDGGSGSEADIKDGSKSSPQSALNRKTRRERAKQNELLTRQQQLERKARDVQRKKSEQRHIMKGQPFEYRPLGDDSTDANATAKYDRALTEQINDLRELARSRQWQKLSVVEQSYSSEDVIAFCKQEIIRLRAIAKGHARQPQMLAQLQAEFDETQECYAAHVRNLRQTLVSSPTASFNPSSLHMEMPALELRWAELAARRADADKSLGSHRDLMLSQADDCSGPLAKRKAPLQAEELPPITFVRLPQSDAVTQQAAPQKNTRPASPQPTQDVTGGDIEVVDLDSKQAGAKTAKSKRKAEAKKRRKERKRAEQQQQGLAEPPTVKPHASLLEAEQHDPIDATDGGSRVVEPQNGEMQAAPSAIDSTTAMPVLYTEVETEAQEPGSVCDKHNGSTQKVDTEAARQDRQDVAGSTTLGAAGDSPADFDRELGADNPASSAGVELKADLIDSSVVLKPKSRTDVPCLARDLRGALSFERLRLKAEQRAEPIPSPLTLGPAMVEGRKIDVAVGGCSDLTEKVGGLVVDDSKRELLDEEQQESGEGTSAPKVTDVVQSPSTIFDSQADPLEQAEQATQETALFDSSSDDAAKSDATDSDGAATFIVPDTLSPRQNERLMIYLRKHRGDFAHEYKSAALQGEVPRLIDLGQGLCVQPLDSNGSGRLVRLVCRSALVTAAPFEQQEQDSAQTPARQDFTQDDEIYIDDGYQASDDSYDSPGDAQSEQSVSSSPSVPQESGLRRRRSLTSSGPATPNKDFSATSSSGRFPLADPPQTASFEDSSPLQHQQRMLLLAQEQLLHQQRKRLLETGDLYGTDEAGASSNVSRISSPAPDRSGSFQFATPAVQLARPNQSEAVHNAEDAHMELFAKQKWQRKRVLDKSRQRDVDQHEGTASTTLEVQASNRKNDGYQLPFQLRRLKMRLARKGITGDTVPSDDDAELEDINRRIQQTQIRRRPLQSAMNGRDGGVSSSARNERRNWQIAEQQSARFWKRASQHSRLQIASNKPACVAERDASRFLGPGHDRTLLTSGGAPLNTCFNAAQTANIGELSKGFEEEAPVKRYSGTQYGKLPRTQVARSLRSRQIGVRLHHKSSSANDSGVVLPKMPKATSLLDWLSATASSNDTRSLKKTSAAARTTFSQAIFNDHTPLRFFDQGTANPYRRLPGRVAGAVSDTRPQHNANTTRRSTDGASATIVELRDSDERQNCATSLLSKGKGSREDHEESDESHRGGRLTQAGANDRNRLEQIARSIVSEMDELE